jgi:hypothetical protein
LIQHGQKKVFSSGVLFPLPKRLMKATLVEKNEMGLDKVPARMTQPMKLANYAESTILSCCRSGNLS